MSLYLSLTEQELLLESIWISELFTKQYLFTLDEISSVWIYDCYIHANNFCFVGPLLNSSWWICSGQCFWCHYIGGDSCVPWSTCSWFDEHENLCWHWYDKFLSPAQQCVMCLWVLCINTNKARTYLSFGMWYVRHMLDTNSDATTSRFWVQESVKYDLESWTYSKHYLY